MSLTTITATLFFALHPVRAEVMETQLVPTTVADAATQDYGSGQNINWAAVNKALWPKRKTKTVANAAFPISGGTLIVSVIARTPCENAPPSTPKTIARCTHAAFAKLSNGALTPLGSQDDLWINTDVNKDTSSKQHWKNSSLNFTKVRFDTDTSQLSFVMIVSGIPDTDIQTFTINY